jgi:hypothetical protein
MKRAAGSGSGGRRFRVEDGRKERRGKEERKDVLGMEGMGDGRRERRGRRWVWMFSVSLWSWKIERIRRGQDSIGMNLYGFWLDDFEISK